MKTFTDFETEGIFIGEIQNFIIINNTLPTAKTLKKLNPAISKVSIKGKITKQIIPFLKLLIDNNYFIILELTGLSYEPDIIKYADFLSIDLKTPSAKIKLPENQFEILSNYAKNHPHIQIKAVVSNEEDLNYVIDIYSMLHDKHPYLPLIITPCWENETPSKELVDMIKDRLIEEKMDYVRVIIQQHKVVYGAKARKV